MKVILLLVLLYFADVESQKVESDEQCFVPVTCSGSGGQHHSTVQWRQITASTCQNESSNDETKVKGQKGQVGRPGVNGRDGMPGISGVNGSMGPKGSMGELGQNGTKGQTGAIGDTGLRGPKGDAGSKGTKGYKGEMGQKGNVSDLQAQLNTLRSRLEDVEDLRNDVNTWKQLANKVSHLVHCDVFYNKTCFRAILHDKEDVDFNAAQSICEDIGWKLANIYDANHYTMIVNYLREKTPSSRPYNTAWLGMTINPQSKEMRYSFGARASDDGMKWFPGYPRSISSYTNIGIYIKRDPGNRNQGIHSYPPTSTRHGAICEI